jgi:RNA polymerase sigma factor (sigma-70 family)
MSNHTNDDLSVDVDDILSDVEEQDAEKLLVRDSVAGYLSSISRIKLLSKGEVSELSRRIIEDNDPEAVSILVLHNLRLVVKNALEYLWSPLPLADIIQAGNLGLIASVKKFDARIGSFSTWATHGIRSSINVAIMEQVGVIHTPRNIKRIQNKILAAQKGLSENETIEISIIAQQLGVSEKVVADALAVQIRMVSLERPFSNTANEKAATLGDFLACDNQLSPDSMAEAQEQLALCCNSLNLFVETISMLPGIKERDVSIFKHRYGLNIITEPLKLNEIGKMFDLTCERVRQVVDNIWKKVTENDIAFNEKMMQQLLERIGSLENLTGTLVRFNE